MLAAFAADACIGTVFQGEIMLAQRGRDFRLHHGQVIELVYHGNINVNGAGFAVAAVGAFSSGEGML